MYKAVGKKYSFERGELHDSNESIEHKSVVEYKVQEALKTLQKQEDELLKKEQELSLRAKEIEPTDDITWRNVKKVIKEQKGINIALRDAHNQASSLQNEIDELEKSISDKNNSIETQKCIIKTKVQENENLKKALVFEQEQTNNLLNIPIQDSKLRSLAINEVKQKAKKYERLQRILNNFLPVLKKVCPSFIRELTDYEIIEPDNTSHIHNLNIYKSR